MTKHIQHRSDPAPTPPPRLGSPADQKKIRSFAPCRGSAAMAMPSVVNQWGASSAPSKTRTSSGKCSNRRAAASLRKSTMARQGTPNRFNGLHNPRQKTVHAGGKRFDHADVPVSIDHEAGHIVRFPVNPAVGVSLKNRWRRRQRIEAAP